MRDLVLDELQVDVAATPGRLRLDWQGESRLRAPEALDPFLERVLADARSDDASIELRFERMTYANSATLVALLRFMKAISDKGLTVHISLDSTSRWQKSFAETLYIFDRKDGRFRLEQL